MPKLDGAVDVPIRRKPRSLVQPEKQLPMLVTAVRLDMSGGVTRPVHPEKHQFMFVTAVRLDRSGGVVKLEQL